MNKRKQLYSNMRLCYFIALLPILAIDESASVAGFVPNNLQGTFGRTTFSNAERNLFSGQFKADDTSVVGNINNRHSATDWLYNVKSLPRSSVLREIKNPVLAVFGWSCLVSVARQVFARSSSSVLNTVANAMCVSSAAHSFLVSSLGLLLVFRTNSAYQRFYEGRKIWEHILSVSRNLSRLCNLYAVDVGRDRKARIMNLVAAYPYLLRHHIRTGCLCEDERSIPKEYRVTLQEPRLQHVETRHEGDKTLGGTTNPGQVSSVNHIKTCWVDRRNTPWNLFDKKSLEKVARARNRPLWVCDRIGQEIVNIPFGPSFTSRERQHFLTSVEKLTDAIGQCERIHQTAVPLNYARHALRSLTMWLFTLPFALVKDLGLMTGPATAVIAWLMFGVYQIGYTIEDPFQGSLRLSILCDAIKSDVIGESEDHIETRESAYSIDSEKKTLRIDGTLDYSLPLTITSAPFVLNKTILEKSSYAGVEP